MSNYLNQLTIGSGDIILIEYIYILFMAYLRSSNVALASILKRVLFFLLIGK